MDELEKIKKEKIRRMMEKIEKQKYPDHPIEVSDKDFESIIAKYPIVVIDCWAEWCLPCKLMAPIIEELAKKYRGKIVFGKLDVSLNKFIPMRFDIKAIPTLLVFKNGELVERIVGLHPSNLLESKLQKYLEEE